MSGTGVEKIDELSRFNSFLEHEMSLMKFVDGKETLRAWYLKEIDK